MNTALNSRSDAALVRRLEIAHDEMYERLVEAQKREWPDSRIITVREMYRTWLRADNKETILLNLAMCLQYRCILFYECSMQNDVYQWRGVRYGTEPSEYLSGFST